MGGNISFPTCTLLEVLYRYCHELWSTEHEQFLNIKPDILFEFFQSKDGTDKNAITLQPVSHKTQCHINMLRNNLWSVLQQHREIHGIIAHVIVPITGVLSKNSRCNGVTELTLLLRDSKNLIFQGRSWLSTYVDRKCIVSDVILDKYVQSK